MLREHAGLVRSVDVAVAGPRLRLDRHVDACTSEILGVRLARRPQEVGLGNSR